MGQSSVKSIKNAVISTLVKDDLWVKQVEVEVCMLVGMPSFQIVGLPEKAVKESRERVRAAIVNSGYAFPVKRVLVNLSPADLPKTGGYFDLPIALGILLAAGYIQHFQHTRSWIWVGELSLQGGVIGSDWLPFVIWTHRLQKGIVLPKEIPLSVGKMKMNHCRQVTSLSDAVRLFVKDEPPIQLDHKEATNEEDDKGIFDKNSGFDFAMITGRCREKLACLIAASGGHHLLFQGPPGVGKTLMARCFSSILPNLTDEHMLDVAMIYSWIGQVRLSRSVPMRLPHHHVTPGALLGGGVPFAPGEISLAHRGVLFLDEITEFNKGLLDQLREALVSREVHVSRVHKKITCAAHFQMIAAMNPCPCGYCGDDNRCICGHLDIKKHQKNISGPFLDRIDMKVVFKEEDEREEVAGERRQDADAVFGHDVSCTRTMKEVVLIAQDAQRKRQGVLNVDLAWGDCQAMAQSARDNDPVFARIEQELNVHGRSWLRVMRVARTIGDLDGCTTVSSRHLQLASEYV